MRVSRVIFWFVFCLSLPGQISSLFGQSVTSLIHDVSNVADGSVTQARLEAQRQAMGAGPAYRSSEKDDFRSFSGRYTPPELSEDKKGRFVYGLALFSDDGCNVTVDSSPIHQRLGQAQHLPDIGTSFQVLQTVLAPGEPIDITVNYSNIIYNDDPDSPDYPDIDGCTLFLYLIPFEIAVDANRDGEVTLGSSTDKTTQERPYVFWINDDYDRDDDEQDNANADWEDGLIQCARDLEDFSRIQISIGGLRDSFATGKLSLGFEWKQLSDNPAIHLYPQKDQSGSDSYLKDELAAAAQIEPGVPLYRWAFQSQSGRTVIGPGQPTVLPAATSAIYFPDFEDTGFISLLFEGCDEGKGLLKITIHNENGSKIGDGPSVWLELKDVRKLYQRSYGKPREGSVTWKKPNEYNPYREPVVSIAPLDDVEFGQLPDETSDTIVLVHGIHAVDVTAEQQAINRYTRMASTTFKRLWWQGFKGRFGFYKWEAHNLVLFNESEYRAWKSGRGLAAFLDQLPGQNKNIWAFSQGTVVGSSAIRDYGATPNALIVMQAAIPAVCYDDNPALNLFPNALPDTVADLGYRGYHGATAVSIINFADPTDVATGLGWRAAQNIKPEPGYGYDPTAPAEQRHTVTYSFEVGRFVTDLHESMSMIAEAKSNSIAYEPTAGGTISASVHLKNQFGFDNEHGAAFDRPIQKNLNDFYDEVMAQFGIPFNP